MSTQMSSFHLSPIIRPPQSFPSPNNIAICAAFERKAGRRDRRRSSSLLSPPLHLLARSTWRGKRASASPPQHMSPNGTTERGQLRFVCISGSRRWRYKYLSLVGWLESKIKWMQVVLQKVSHSMRSILRYPADRGVILST